MIYLDRCIGSCNTLNELSNEVCVPNKTGDLNLSVLNMITRINESKTLTNHMSFECKYKFVIQVKSRIMINGDAIKKKIIYVKNIIFGILLHVVAKIVIIFSKYY